MPKTQEYLDQLAARTSLDCGGYTWENPEPGSALDKIGAVTTDGGIEYFLGGDAIPRKHVAASLAFLAFVEDGLDIGDSFPDTLPCDDEGIYVKLCSGMEYGVDRECDWCGAGTGNEECREFCEHNVKPDADGIIRHNIEHCREACTRCEGTGYQDCPGGPWAWYGYQENEDEEE